MEGGEEVKGVTYTLGLCEYVIKVIHERISVGKKEGGGGGG